MNILKKGRSVSNCREYENMLSPCRKKIHIFRMFSKGWTDFKCLYRRIYLIWHTKDWRCATELSIPFIIQYLCWPKFLPLIFSLCFFIPYVVNNPIFYGALTL